MQKYFLVDVETGGLDCTKHSLLTLYGFVFKPNMEIIDRIDLKIKPNDGCYHLEVEAMAINKINILEHDKEAITEQQASLKLRDFLFAHSEYKATKLIPVGHNVNFDMKFIQKKLVPDINDLCSHRQIDTASISQFFMLSGKLPIMSGSLSAICKHYEIDTTGAHNAKVDAENTFRLLQAMINCH